MLRRLALPLGVVLLLVAIALVSLRLGYLGRRPGGPLTEPRAFPAVTERASLERFNVVIAPYAVDGDPVRITGARPTLMSPGLRLRGPRRHSGSIEFLKARRWPPRGDLGDAVGRRLRGTGSLALGLRVRRPGTYVLWGYELDYQQGARSYRRTVGGDPVCLTRGGRCPTELELPDAARHPLADIGGPSDYGGRPVPGPDGPRVVVPASPGARTIRVTLTNVGDDRIDVRDLRLTPIRYEGFSLSSAAVAPFALDPGAHREVELELTGEGCAYGETFGAVTPADEALRATVDGTERAVPLLTAVDVRGAAVC